MRAGEGCQLPIILFTGLGEPRPNREMKPVSSVQKKFRCTMKLTRSHLIIMIDSRPAVQSR